MTSMVVISEPEALHQICRLCMSEESLHSVWDTKDLHRWISDYLTITVSIGDRMSQSICTICQIRITEIHHFRISCQEVQAVLQSMMEDDNMKRVENGLPSAAQEQQPEISESETVSLLESDHSEDSNERHAQVYYEEMEDEQLEDEFVVEEIKVESRTGEESESFDVGRSPAFPEKDVTKDPVLECDICLKSVPSTKLWYHKNMAHEEKYFNCTVCGVGFTLRDNLMEHFKSEQHLRTAKELRFKSDDADKFKCDICQRAFTSETTLNEHIKQSHGPEFSCDICGKVFRYSGWLLQHKKSQHTDGLDQVQQEGNDVHSADRPFKCDLCRATFKKINALNWHIGKVHGPKPLECSMCNYKCSYTYNLNRHMQNHLNGKRK